MLHPNTSQRANLRNLVEALGRGTVVPGPAKEKKEKGEDNWGQNRNIRREGFLLIILLFCPFAFGTSWMRMCTSHT